MNSTLTRWRKVCEAAPPQPWEWEGRYLLCPDYVRPKQSWEGDDDFYPERKTNTVLDVDTSSSEAAEEFIALSRTALPVAIECLEMALKALRTCDHIVKAAKVSTHGHEHINELIAEEALKQIHARLESCK